MAIDLPFEKRLNDVRNKIEELRKLSEASGIDFSEEITRLEERLAQEQEHIYSELTPAQKMHIARHQSRPTSLDLIQLIFTDFIELHGDRFFADDLAIVGGIAKLEGLPVTVVGHQRGKDTKDNIARFFGSPHPEGFRKALRLMKQAEKFGRPIVTLIDTKGAYPGNTAEERGISESIARNLRSMATLTVPVICVVIGEGGSGGALALGVGNRVLMLENAIYSVISPNGAASILWKDASRADEAAGVMKITAKDLLAFGVIEEIVPEPMGGAHHDYAAVAESIKAALWRHLQELLPLSKAELVEDRYAKFRKIGVFREEAPAAEVREPHAPDPAALADHGVQAVPDSVQAVPDDVQAEGEYATAMHAEASAGTDVRDAEEAEETAVTSASIAEQAAVTGTEAAAGATEAEGTDHTLAGETEAAHGTSGGETAEALQEEPADDQDAGKPGAVYDEAAAKALIAKE